MKIIYDDISMRDTFGRTLNKMAEKFNNIFAVSADTEVSMGYSAMAEMFPDRVINVGICEQNMALVAAGIASCGGKAFAATYAPFASMRMLEQIRTFIAYPKLDVKIIAGMGGLSGSYEGVTHQGLEDISIMRSIPNMIVIVPADSCSTEAITNTITEYNGPIYLRLGRQIVPKVFNHYKFRIGKANILKNNGSDAAVVCNGAAVYRVLQAEKLLAKKGINISIIEMACVKPIDQDAVILAAKLTGRIITVEENNVIGGLGSAVAETVSEKFPIPVLRLGIEDIFTESGPYEELLDKYGLSSETISIKIEKFIYTQKNNNI